MALLAFWKSNRAQVLGLSIQQIVSNAGDGKLRDGSECANEFRQFLREAPSEYLASYISTCLDQPFADSGLVLQDIVNEIGRRLEFEVKNGLYRGKKNAIGFDGIWRSGETEILIEVKTTDYITVSLDKIADYKKRLSENGELSREACVLIVVGREDTGALEAQIRGSRYAWETRLISVDSLIQVMKIKEKSNEETTIRQIKELLQPFEYTKVDKIIDVIFSTAEDVSQGLESEAGDTIPPSTDDEAIRSTRTWTRPQDINAKREMIVEWFGKLKGTSFLKHRKTLFWAIDEKIRICVALSKRYELDYQPYWYAFHPQWDDFLREGLDAYFILGCMDRDEAFAIPYGVLSENLINLNVTEREDGKHYWHVVMTTSENNSLAWNLTKARKKIDLTHFACPLKTANSM